MAKGNRDSANHQVLRKFSLIVGTIAAALVLMGISRTGFENKCEAEETDCVVLTQINFSPQDGSYNVNWPGPPRHKATYAGVERFVVNMGIDRPAPMAFSRQFLIREDRTFGWVTLGKFTATFSAGSTTPTITYSRQCCGASTYPSGTPATITDGTFWMTCTKKGNVKANGKKGDDRNATVRLEKVNKSDGIGVKGKFSQKHTINCV